MKLHFNQVLGKTAAIVSMIVVIYFVNYTAKYSTAVLLSSELSSEIWKIGSASADLVPQTPHSYRYYTNRASSFSVFGKSARVTLRPQLQNAAANFSRVPNLFKNPIYWECSPARYLRAYLFILFTVLFTKRFIEGNRGGGFLSRKTILVASSFYILGIGMIYPALRLFWSGMQESLKLKYISDTNELDSTRLLWMSSEMHNILFVGVLGAVLWSSISLCVAARVRCDEKEATDHSRHNFVRRAIGIGLIFYCLSAPLSMPLTIGLII